MKSELRSVLGFIARPIAALAVGATTYYVELALVGLAGSGTGDGAGKVLFLIVFGWTLHGHPENVVRWLVPWSRASFLRPAVPDGSTGSADFESADASRRPGANR